MSKELFNKQFGVSAVLLAQLTGRGATSAGPTSGVACSARVDAGATSGVALLDTLPASVLQPPCHLCYNENNQTKFP